MAIGWFTKSPLPIVKISTLSLLFSYMNTEWMGDSDEKA